MYDDVFMMDLIVVGLNLDRANELINEGIVFR